MGSFNQTCLLTRSPITYGDDVVVWNSVEGPWAHHDQEQGEHSLLFGLPQRAQYDDYGGAEDYRNSALEALHQRAWEQQTLYKRHTLDLGYGTHDVYVACSAETMSRVHDIEALFYDGEELTPLSVFEEGYDAVYLAKKGRAQERARQALETIGQRIGAASLPTEKAAFQAAVFQIVADVVGHALAWPLWAIISKGELFATQHLCMVRAEAYDYVVDTIGSSMVSKYQVANTKQSYRQRMEQRWLAWEEKHKHNLATAKNNPMRQMALADATLTPMARPWGVEGLPITSFFWNALEYDEVVSTAGRDLFLDMFVFMKGLAYLRSPLAHNPGGGQTSDWKLHAGLMKAVHKKARGEGPLRRDWYPYI